VDDANTKNISVETSAVQVFYSGTFTLGVGLHKVAIVLTNGAASDLFIDWFGIGPVKSAADSPALSREEIKVRQDDTYVIPMWEFDEAGNTEGWEGYNGASVTGVSGGSLNLTTTNTEPVLLSPRVFVDQNQNKYVSFKMKVDRGTSGKLQWVRQDIPGPLGEMSFDIEADGQFHVYNIDLSSGSNYAFWGNTWNYYLTGFMLLPTNASGASVQIDWIRISNVKQGEAEINITYFGIEEGGRAGESIPLWLKVENAGGGTWYSGAVTLNLKNGETVVFYRDIKAGSPILALSAAGLTGNTQAQSVSALGFSETVSYLVIKQRLIPADNSSACTITVTVTDYYRNPLSGQAVIITTSRKGTGLDAYDFITQPGITDPSGVCTGAVVSSYGGLDTITAYIEGNSVKRVENTVLADGLIGMWNFDDGSGDVAYDLSINNNTGTITSPSWTNGLLGPCLSVNGTTGYVSVENNATLNPGAAISVEAWVKMNANDNYAEIVRKEPCYFMRKTSIGEGNNFNFFICTGGGWEPRAASSLIPDSGPNAPWYHIVGTYDSSIGGNNNKLYIDGAVDGSSAKTGPIDSSANPLRIGGLGAIWNGVMDEVRMYSRALPLDEIKAGYERKPKPVTFTGMNLKILTPQRTAAQGAATDSITVEVQGLGGGRDVSFYDTVILSSSSPGGSFSIDNIVWADTTNIYLSSGYGVFYYKDTNIGNPVITAYRESLIADTQGETITAGGAGYFSFISPEFRIRAADTSPLVTAVAYDSGGNTDVSFSSTVSLFTSSSSGSFSVSTTPWADTSTITFLNGFGYFYYRDNAVGNPVLSAMSYELSADTQVETITIRYLRFSNTTPFTITSISTAPVFLKAVDGSGNTAVLFNDTVQLLTTSTKGYFSVSGTTWVNTSIVYLVSGGKTVYYKDKIGGNPVITVTRTDSWTWTDTQQETVTKPTVLTSKVQMNVRSGETGSMPMKFWVSDTVEYTVYISNTGTETATNNLIVDTRSFDTSVNNPVDYIYMDTSGFADTWAYTTDLVSWTTGNPASGTSNVKGLRWRIDSLGINQTKAIRFRVRVK